MTDPEGPRDPERRPEPESLADQERQPESPPDQERRPDSTELAAPIAPDAPADSLVTTAHIAPTPPSAIPTVPETIRTAVDALLASSRDLRILSSTAVLFGVVLVVAPLVAAAAYFVTAPLISSFGPADDPLLASLGLAAVLALLAGVMGYFVFAIQFPLMIIAVIGGRISGRPLDLRQALRRARQVFWRAFGASVLIGLVTALPAGVVVLFESFTIGTETQLALGVNILAGLLLGSPWVYVLPGIVLGGVGVLESLRRSWRLARFRWRLAFTIALLGVVGGQIVTAAALAVVGAVLTVASIAPGGAALASATPPSALIGAAIVVGAVVVSSLFFATQAVEVAPETSGFWALTHYASGLEAAREGPPEPLLRKPARVIYPLGLVATVALAVGLAGSWPVAERGPWQRVQVGGFSFEVPSGWTREASDLVTAAFTNGGDGRITIRIGDASVQDAAERHFESFFPVEEVEVISSEPVSLEGTRVEEAIAVGRLIFLELPVLVEAGSLRAGDATLVVSLPASDDLLGEFYLGEARRFARHIWSSALKGP